MSEPAQVENIKPSPLAVTNGTEASIAEQLVTSDICHRLRRIVAGPRAGLVRWDGRRWASCPDQLPPELVKAVRNIVTECVSMRLIELRAAPCLERASAIRGIAEMAFAHSSLHLDAAAIDPPWSLNTPCGLVDLRAGTMRQTCPSDPICSITGAPWDPAASSPWWGMIQNHIEKCDPSGFVHRFIGAAACGLPADRLACFLVDAGQSGKSTLFECLSLTFGDYAGLAPAEALSEGNKSGAHTMELLHAVGSARLLCAPEVTARLDWVGFKSLTGGDGRMIKRLHGKATTVRPRVHLILRTNDLPAVPHSDLAVADRVAIVRLQPIAEPDDRPRQILAEDTPERQAMMAACLQWVVAGAIEFARSGYGVRPTGGMPIADPEGVALWWEQRIDIGFITPSTEWTPASKVARDATDWFMGRRMPAPSTQAIGRFVRGKVEARRVGHGNVLCYRLTLGATRRDTIDNDLLHA